MLIRLEASVHTFQTPNLFLPVLPMKHTHIMANTGKEADDENIPCNWNLMAFYPQFSWTCESLSPMAQLEHLDLARGHISRINSEQTVLFKERAGLRALPIQW